MYHYNSNYDATPRVNITISLTPTLVVLQIVFLVLKLCGVIDWEWVYVCIPSMVIGGIWALTFLMICVMIIASLIINALNDKKEK